jgi:hypothetical protein
MTTKLLTYPNNKPTAITRNLSDGPDYSPDWRHRVVEEQIPTAIKNDERGRDQILSKEKDEYVRALIEFHLGRSTPLHDAIDYAVRCHRDRAPTRVAGAIKAMVIGGRTAEQIAKLIGTSPEKVTAFENVFFDVRRHLARRVWLKTICFPSLDPQPEAYREAEARLMQIAFNRGWNGLYPFFCAPSSSSARPGAQHLMRLLTARAADYVDEMEMRGTPMSDRDIQRLLVAQHAMSLAKIPITQKDLAFDKAIEPEKEKRSLARAESIPPESRRRLVAAFNVITTALRRKAKQLPAAETEKSP